MVPVSYTHLEAEAAGSVTLKSKRRVGFEEVVMRTDLNRTVAGVGHAQRYPFTPGVEFDFSGFNEQFTCCLLYTSRCV